MWFLKYNPAELALGNKGKKLEHIKSKSIEELQQTLQYDMRDALDKSVEVLSHTPGNTVKVKRVFKTSTKPKANAKPKATKTKKVYKPKHHYKKKTNNVFMFSGGCDSCMVK